MQIAVYNNPSYYRSRALANGMAAGARRHGHKASVWPSNRYAGVIADAAVFYGFAGNAPRIFDEYQVRGYPVVVLDLGYWSRDSRKKMEGYNKVTVNSRHPDAYFQAHAHPSDRFDALGLQIKPWRESGDYVLVCGMSAKAAKAAGLAPMQWETEVVKKIKSVTDIPIVYRPKPGRKSIASAIGGTTQLPEVSIEDALERAHICVARHSNACADALIAGVPVHCEEGVASAFSTPLDQIESPIMPEGRDRWAADVAYCQWTLGEISKGECWDHLTSEGLVP